VLVLAVITMLIAYQSALGPLGGLGLSFLCASIFNKGPCCSGEDIHHHHHINVIVMTINLDTNDYDGLV
jgi:hypothetical protein